MNLTLTMQFENLEELQQFLARNPAAAAQPVATPASAEVVSITPDPIPATPTPDPYGAEQESYVPEIVPDVVEQTAAATPPADPGALRQELMAKLKELAGGLDDPAVLGKFINNFGVARFSELPDEQLESFQGALINEFG